MDIIELNDGTSISCKALTKSEYDSILTQEKPSFLKKYSELYSLDVYLLNNGNVVVREADYYTLYIRLVDLDHVLSQSNDVGGFEMLLNKNAFGEKFPLHTKELVMEVANKLKVDVSRYDDELLRIVDTKVSLLGAKEDFSKKYFLHLIALVGEVLREKHGLEWEMVLGSDVKTWNPYLKVKQERVQFFGYLYEDIFLTKPHEHFLEELSRTMDVIIRNNVKG
jgi:hypothetical protein